jgi:hypothetical protein
MLTFHVIWKVRECGWMFGHAKGKEWPQRVAVELAGEGRMSCPASLAMSREQP